MVKLTSILISSLFLILLFIVKSGGLSYLSSDDGLTDYSKENKLEQKAVNVKSFGVMGDGVTDDTKALQSAINSGLPLYFPKGTHCVITSALSSPNGNILKIVGSGKNNSSIKQLTKGLRIIYINGKNTEISNISFYGTGQGFIEGESENGALLDFIGKGAVIDNCRFEDADYISILVKPTSGNVIITNSLFTNAWAEEIAYWANTGLIKGNVFKNGQNNAIVTRGATDVLIEENIFDNIGRDIDACIDIRNSHNNIFLPSNRIKIHNNIFTDCFLPISSSSETSAVHKDISITDNEIFSESAPTYDILIRMYAVENIKFNNNKIYKGGKVRAVLLDGENIIANNNEFDSLPEALNINANGQVSVDDNTFKNITGSALVLRGKSTKSFVSVRENKFDSVGIGIDTPSLNIGNLLVNGNLFKNIATMSVKINYNIIRLETVGNIFEDGHTKSIQISTAPTTWIKE
ncbi:right-handed parallel beta-helix repeat-containing protein [Bacillus sp. 22-7]|uniref:right-handed parallel beta-helix repeat-containing protein n=1 Tax=Bacillus sp. 22-7 TaxID=2709707 RepID=UPI001952E237|nr:right-handed parallel beta-helix repeat-containing protein [Bacillus sp. 22-7]